MVSAASIGAAQGGGYARYLEGKTVEPERGDYYLTPTGEPAQAPGRWLAADETLELLGIAVGEPVRARDFVALMEGRHPHTGGWLRPEGAGGGRGGGIDLTFSAPKSVSVAWALSHPEQRNIIEQAHARAVEQSVAYLREEIPALRRRWGGVVFEERAKDLIAAEYRHTTARGVSGAEAPDPQLHSHVVISGALREDGRLVAVASRPIFRAKRELGAYYRSALAHELTESGFVIRGASGKDGRYFEIEGVPESLREAFSGRSREVARAAERFRAQYGRAPLPGELRHLKLENRRAKQLTTRGDLDRAWRETGHRHGFGVWQAIELCVAEAPPLPHGTLADRIEERLTEQHATFRPTELRAVALEQSVGQLPPHRALAKARAMIRERRIVPLEGDRMTTLAQRAREQTIERRIAALAAVRDVDIADSTRRRAANAVAERIGAPLSAEQHHALQTITGPERVAVLIGPAGTGKGVVIDAAARAEQASGRDAFGVAVSGSTAERLGIDCPALEGRTLTVDALAARAERGSATVGRGTTVFLDEAGMIDTKRLDKLTNLVERSGAKLVAIGDGQQLPSIGPGGMFDRLPKLAPTAQLGEIHRTSDPDEQRAWAFLRAGEPEQAMAHYQARGQLFLIETRDQACEAAVRHWAELTKGKDPGHVALLTDASNIEVNRLNARAQHHRAQRGELGEREIELSSVPYGLREGDRVAFVEQHRLQGERRVENGSCGQVTQINARGDLDVELDGTHRRITLGRDDVEKLRLAYAGHIHREQGATVEQTIAITGGWQTSRETAYVEATRAKHGTRWFVARDDLGADGQDADRVIRLAGLMRASRAQTPTLEYREIDPLEPDRYLSRFPGLTLPRVLAFPGHDHDYDHDRGR
jgi:conjugative relaxase-like TrwC/TraI family protein